MLVGGAASRLCVAGGLARDLGATIHLADNGADALSALHHQACDLVMIEVTHDVGEIVRLLRAGRFTMPVLACGIGVPAELAVMAVKAGARDYVALPPAREVIRAVLTGQAVADAGGTPVDALVGHKMDAVEQALILETLQRCNGNRTAASQLLGISVRTMRNKLRAFMDAGVAVPPAAA